MVTVLAGLHACTTDTETSLSNNFKKHIEYLASDELEGREAGSEGEKKAASYVASNFESFGLSPKGTEGYYQEFEFLLGKNIESNLVELDGVALPDDDTHYPLNYTGNGEVKGELLDVGFGIEAQDLNYNDYQGLKTDGKIFIMKVSSPDGIHPHSKYLSYHNLRDRVKLAESKGALAVLLINTEPGMAKVCLYK